MFRLRLDERSILLLWAISIVPESALVEAVRRDSPLKRERKERLKPQSTREDPCL